MEKKKRLLIIGFHNFSEKMYPHTYEVICLLNRSFSVSYCGTDDKGQFFVKIPSLLRPALDPAFMLFKFGEFSWRFKHYLYRKGEILRYLKDSYDLIIAMDHSALDMVARYGNPRTPLIFWSMDIITPDHWWMNSWLIRRMLSRNKRQVSGCSLIIIQDRNRAAVLDSVLGSHAVPKFFLPVSLPDDQFSLATAGSKGNGNTREVTRVGLIGSISEDRGAELILRAFVNLDTRIDLILNGEISHNIKVQIANMEKKPICYPVSESLGEMRHRLSTFDIGIIALKEKNLNNHFYSFASGQMVEYLRLGIPVVVVFSDELGAFAEEKGIGIYVSDLARLKEAITLIKHQYHLYSYNAYYTYKTLFDLNMYGERLICVLNSIQ